MAKSRHNPVINSTTKAESENICSQYGLEECYMAIRVVLDTSITLDQSLMPINTISLCTQTESLEKWKANRNRQNTIKENNNGKCQIAAET